MDSDPFGLRSFSSGIHSGTITDVVVVVGTITDVVVVVGTITDVRLAVHLLIN